MEKTLKEEFLNHYIDCDNEVFKIMRQRKMSEEQSYYVIHLKVETLVDVTYEISFKEINDKFELISYKNNYLSTEKYFNKLLPFIENLKLKLKLEKKLPDKNIITKGKKI